MLSSIRLSSVFVFDQDEALEFYAGKLGLEIAVDQDLGFMRWLTVRVPGDPGREILLEKIGAPSVDDVTAGQVREVVSKGAGGGWIGFTTDDVHGTFEALKGKGVEITDEPTERGYGTDFGIRDPFGNAIRVLQPANVAV